MDRRAFLGTLGLVAAARKVEAQPGGKVPRIGVICGLSCAPDNSVVRNFTEGLGERGWEEGRNLRVEWREGTPDKEESLAADLVQRRVDVIVTLTTSGTRAASKATGTIPIVMGLYSLDPVANGLVASLSRPGGNITGFVSAVPGQVLKLPELLKEVVPRLSRLAHVWDEGWLPYPPTLGTRVDSRLGLKLQPVLVRTAEDIKRAMQTLGTRRIEAIWTEGTSLLSNHTKLIADAALSQRLPSISYARWFPESGGLMSYWSNQDDIARRASGHVDKILRGANPAELPVEQPTKFQLIINLKTAKALGVKIPPSLAQRADQVIE